MNLKAQASTNKEAYTPPALPVDDFIRSINLPRSTFAKMILEGHGPQLFVLGRRRYITHADGIAWVNNMRERFAYTKRVNNPRRQVSSLSGVSA